MSMKEPTSRQKSQPASTI